MGDQLKIGAPPDGPLESGGVASGGVPASLMEFKSNRTIGRIKTLECLKSSDPKACEKAHLDELSQRYADHVSGKMPLPPDESLELRAKIQRLDSELYPDRTSLWPDYSPAEKDYLAQKAAEKRRFANNIGILGGGLVFAGLPAMGRVLNAPEDVVEQLGVLNVELVGLSGLKQRVIKPVPNKPETVLVYRKKAGRAKGVYVEKPILKYPPGSRPASEEIKDLSKFEGKSKSEIEKELREAGYTEVPSKDGTGSVWTKEGSDGNTAAVRLDRASTKGKGFADEVDHAHKEIVASNKVVDGNYKAPKYKFDDLGNIKIGTNAEIARDVHIPIKW